MMLKILRLLFAARIELVNNRRLAPVKTNRGARSMMANTVPLNSIFSLSIKFDLYAVEPRYTVYLNLYHAIN